MKRTLFFVGYIVFCSIVPASAQDDWKDWDFQYNGVCYTVVSDSSSQKVEVSLQNDGPFNHQDQVNYPFLDTIVIPSIVYDSSGLSYTVIGVGKCAFLNCCSLKKIFLPSTVKYLSGWAFMGCVNLEYVEIPDGLEQVGPYVFADCTSLEELQLPSTTQVDNCAFMWTPFRK